MKRGRKGAITFADDLAAIVNKVLPLSRTILIWQGRVEDGM